MNRLDPDTLIFANISGRCAYVILFLVSAFRNRNELYLFHWAASIVLSVLGLILNGSAAGYPYLPPLRGAFIYAIYGFSIVFCWSGVRLFAGKRVVWEVVLLQGAIPGILYGVVDVIGTHSSIALGAMFAGLTVPIACAVRELLSITRREHLSSQFLATAALGAYLLMFLGSMTLLFIAERELPRTSSRILLSLIIDQFCSILIYISFLSMAGERASVTLERMATTDSLTGLSNRYGVAVLAKATMPLLARKGQSASILLADIDQFKSINDHYGHEAGDAVLAEFAKRCRRVLKRRTDILARWGGEEFLAVLHDVTLEQAIGLAETLRAVTEDEPFLAKGARLPVTVSIGVACVPPNDTLLENAVWNADRALYRAKEAGRNRVCANTSSDS